MILVDIFVTSLDKSYDFQLNDNVKVETIIEEISEMVCQKERMKVVGDTSGLMLCDMFAHKVLEKDKTLLECGVYTGNKLMLI
jgi:UDP-N-acetylmuramate-alanine ligase